MLAQPTCVPAAELLLVIETETFLQATQQQTRRNSRMFALLGGQSSNTSALPVHWGPAQRIKALSSSVTAANVQQPLLSVLDALAAPTVFMQQALVFGDAICAADLAEALQLVLQGYPALGYRLSKGKVRKRSCVYRTAVCLLERYRCIAG
jgi:hypothetical protein